MYFPSLPPPPPFISNLFYENQLIGIKYAEPYSGGAGLALRLLFEGYVNHIYINDLDKSIYAFWQTLMDRPDEFCRWIEDIEVFYRKLEKSIESFGEMQTILVVLN